jgi:MFS family permease
MPDERRRRRGFTVVAAVLGLFLCAAAAPTPLYKLYADRWHFSAINLTAVFAVYALALLASLLLAGSLSDAVGRRAVIALALALESFSMAAFLIASGLAWLYAARTIQGVATGLATAAVAAALIDLQGNNAGRGALVNAVTPTFGLAVGAVGAAVLVQYEPAPTRLVYGILLAGFMAGAVALLAVPETVTTRRRPPLNIAFGVEKAARPALLSALPALVATWALGGLYLSLGPSVAYSLAGSTNRVIGGAAVALLTATGGLSSLLVHNRPARWAMLGGCGALACGVTVTVLAVMWTSQPVFYIGTFVSGFGFGATFLGAFRTLIALATPQARAGLVATVYVVAYLAFSLPAVAAGILTTRLGLRTSVIGYGVVVAGLALLAIPATAATTAAQRSAAEPTSRLSPAPELGALPSVSPLSFGPRERSLD